MNQEEEISRGRAASELLGNHLMVEAFSTVKNNLHYNWENSSAADGEARNYMYLQLKAINAVFEHLKSVMETGKMAEQTQQEYENGTNRSRSIV